MITAGIDVGGKAVKAVILEEDKVLGRASALTGLDRRQSAREAYEAALRDAGVTESAIERVGATGTGRSVVDWSSTDASVVSCVALGVSRLMPDILGYIDIGANEARAAKLEPEGGVADFAVNEKCGAGSGAFVEAMARAMQVSLEGFSDLALKSSKSIPINAQCVVFAESEVVSLIHEETAREDICKAVCDAIAARVSAMARKVRLGDGKAALVGGVAHNQALKAALEAELELSLIVPEWPEYVAAYGAAGMAKIR
jgi:predicted CoA-substrate-specific enzyme activase